MARGFESHLSYRQSPDAEEKQYDLKVNHPLTIGSTDVFLIGHGYAPVITVRDGNGDVVYNDPTVFLPLDQSFRSVGVVKAPDAEPTQIGLEGEFYPTVAFSEETGSYYSLFGKDVDPMISMLVYTGDLGIQSKEGYVTIKGRSKLIIEVAGHKVDPFEIEEVLGTHPAVAEAVVVGIPDARTGEQRLKAVIAGEQHSTIYKDTRQLAEVAVSMVDALLKGEEPETNDITSYDNGVKVVPSYLLKPQVVTKANYQDVLVGSGYYTQQQLG